MCVCKQLELRCNAQSVFNPQNFSFSMYKNTDEYYNIFHV